MITDFPDLGLLKGDRVEVHAGMERLEQFHTAARPFNALFWRRADETMCRRRNPLFAEVTGLVPQRCMVPEPLHALSLGVYQFWISLCWFALMEKDVFLHGPNTVEVKKQRFIQEVHVLNKSTSARAPSGR